MTTLHPRNGALRGVDALTPAVVLGVHGHNGLGQIRTLARLGVPVYVVHHPGRTPPTYSRYITRRFEWAIDADHPERTVDLLLDVVASALGRRAVLLASDDASSIIICEHGPRLRERFLVPDQEPSLNRSLLDKLGLHELCRKTGTPSPVTVVPQTSEEVESFARTATYPVVVKAKNGWRLRGVSDVFTLIAHDQDELLADYGKLAVNGDLNIILQQYIPGGPESVWIFHGYCNAAGELIFALVGNKLREYPVDGGMTTFAVNRPNDVVLTAATSLVRTLGYRGIIDLDLRFDPRDGQYKAIDFNPRSGANFRCFVDDHGIDVVRAAYLDLTGQPVPVGRQRVGRKWMLENADLAASRTYIIDGRMSVRDALRSLRGLEEVAWFAHDDPLPFVVVARGFARSLLRWLGRRAGGANGSRRRWPLPRRSAP